MSVKKGTRQCGAARVAAVRIVQKWKKKTSQKGGGGGERQTGSKCEKRERLAGTTHLSWPCCAAGMVEVVEVAVARGLPPRRVKEEEG